MIAWIIKPDFENKTVDYISPDKKWCFMQKRNGKFEVFQKKWGDYFGILIPDLDTLEECEKFVSDHKNK